MIIHSQLIHARKGTHISRPFEFDYQSDNHISSLLTLVFGKSVGRRAHETADLRTELDEDVHYASSVLRTYCFGFLSVKLEISYEDRFSREDP